MATPAYINYKEKYPNTYFLLLPKELLSLLSLYYYGLLELEYIYFSNIKGLLTIRKFDNHSKLEFQIQLIIIVTKLLSIYNEKEENMTFTGDSENVVWRPNEVGILIENGVIYIRNYMAELFWQKVRAIVDMINNLINSGLGNREIMRRFEEEIF